MNQYRIDSFIQQWKQDPKSRVFLRLAEEYRKGGAFDKAIDVCLEGLETHPNYLPAKVCLGRCRQELGRLEEAENNYRDVLQESPDNPHALQGLGSICFEAGRFDEALAQYEMLALHGNFDEDIANRILAIKERIAESSEEDDDETDASFEASGDFSEHAQFDERADVASALSDSGTFGEIHFDDSDEPDEIAVANPNREPEVDLDEAFDDAIHTADSLEPDLLGELTPESDEPVINEPLNSDEEARLTRGLKHEKMEHLEAALKIYQSLLVSKANNATVKQHFDRVRQIMATESKERKKTRLLSNWLDKVKGVYYVQ